MGCSTPARHRLACALLATPLVALLLGSSCYPGAGQERQALVVYNANAGPDALAIAQYYASQRQVPAANLCPVELPTGHYATPEHLLGARRTIVEDCICATINESVRPDPCNTSNIDAVRAESEITHLALIRGIPARLHGTPWPSDFEEPSFDHYLANLVYRDIDLFGGGSMGITTTTYLTPDLIDQANSVMILSAPALDPAIHADLAYGRIEAIDTARTLDLIDRTLAAESQGFQGNLLEERNGKQFTFLRDVSGSRASECIDYITYEPFLFGAPESSWPFDTCRAGTTWVLAKGPDPGSSSDDPIRAGLPGGPMTTIPLAVDVGLMLGSMAGPNAHSGFNDFSTLTNWRKGGAACEPLCSMLPTQPERDACAAASTDYFRELNTDCVGAAPGFLGHQVRSYPVQYYGFMPPGWNGDSNGSVEKTPPVVATGGAWQDARFTDDLYLHVGHHDVANPDTSQCTLEGGSTVACPEHLAIDLVRAETQAPALAVSGSRDFTITLRHRNQASPGGSLRVLLRLHDGATLVEKEALVALDTANLTWATAQLPFQVLDSEVAQIDRIDVAFATRLQDGAHGFIDLDGVELVDEQTGDQLVDAVNGSFADPDHGFTAWGDWAANAIDRLGAVAWWGSSSHHINNGFAFSEARRFYGAFFQGRTLGESLLLTASGHSGIIYGDPLYRPIAVRLHIPGVDGYGKTPGLAVNAATLPLYGTVLVNAYLGGSGAAKLLWAIGRCPTLDIDACDAGGMWQEQLTGIGAIEDLAVDWGAQIDPGVAQDVLLRLRVWRPGEEADAFYHFAYFTYSP